MLENDSFDSFQSLATLRRRLAPTSFEQKEALDDLWADEVSSFRAFPKEAPTWHLTTSATSLDSLFLAPSSAMRDRARDRARAFATAALRHAPEEWVSDGTAGVYARVRSLPIVLATLDGLDDSECARVGELLEGVRIDGPSVREEAVGDKQYPPSTYHTYWYLATEEGLRRHSNLRSRTRDRFQRDALEWFRGQVGVNAALGPQAASFDADALAWALAGLLRFSSGPPSARDRDLIMVGLESLMKSQLSDGRWRHSRPLFHYPSHGSAYCYVFETAGVLLRDLTLSVHWNGLGDESRRFLPMWHLLYENSIRTSIRSGNALGWLAEHRHGIGDRPDTWATASVYLFRHALRRCVAKWVREHALNTLGRRPTKTGDDVIRTFGDTWLLAPNDLSAGLQLTQLLLNPIARAASKTSEDPDEPAIAPDVSCSTVLYGPPGTSKTTLASALAGALGWDYVELHASHFVRDGLQNVQRTADRLFELVGELDRAVVLFDEIDELVRDRDGGGTESLQRFLTTSMLPKLASLWKARRIVYIVATNHINRFDDAIKRAERFDALIMVPPPSLPKKLSELGLSDKSVSLENVNRALEAASKDGSADVLYKLALLRFDELADVRRKLEDVADASDEARLRKVLGNLGSDGHLSPDAATNLLTGYRSQRRDARMTLVP